MPSALNMSCTGVVGMAMECALQFSISRGVRSYGECGSIRHTLSHIRKAPHLREEVEVAMDAAMIHEVLQGNG